MIKQNHLLSNNRWVNLDRIYDQMIYCANNAKNIEHKKKHAQ